MIFVVMGSGAVAGTRLRAQSYDALASLLAGLVTDAIPREYEKKQDWGRTKRITTGLRADGNGLDFRIHRRKTQVNHGTWKHYKVRLVNPDEHLEVRIENLRSLEAGRIGLTLYLRGKLHGWAQTRIYNRGLHIITLTAEGDTTLRLWVDCEISMKLAPSLRIPGVSVEPLVTGARLELDDFDLDRLSKVSGELAHELGEGLSHVIEETLDGPTLVAKLNRAIDKKRDRLQISPSVLSHLPAFVGSPARSD
jgi:hypothetical protein